MFLKSYYKLAYSESFELNMAQELVVNLNLQKQEGYYHTLLCGRVDHEKRPLEYAVVQLFDLEKKPVFHTVTNEYGYFEFREILEPGVYYAIASHKCYKTSNVKRVQVFENDRKELTFTLVKNPSCFKGVIYGCVKNVITTEGLSDVKITLIDTMSGTRAKTYTNECGQYILYNLPPGSYKLVAEHVYFEKFISTPVFIYKEEKTKLNFNMYPDPLLAKGTVNGVINHEGKPVENAAVFLCKPLDKNDFDIIDIQATNKSGDYLIGNVPAGDYSVKAEL